MLISRGVRRSPPRTAFTAATRRAATALAFASLGGCGGGDSPTGPSLPPGPTSDVVAVVFYDENGNGRIDPGEGARLPDVMVEVGGRTGRSERASGRAVVSRVPQGAQTLQVRASS